MTTLCMEIAHTAPGRAFAYGETQAGACIGERPCIPARRPMYLHQIDMTTCIAVRPRRNPRNIEHPDGASPMTQYCEIVSAVVTDQCCTRIPGFWQEEIDEADHVLLAMIGISEDAKGHVDEAFALTAAGERANRHQAVERDPPMAAA